MTELYQDPVQVVLNLSPWHLESGWLQGGSHHPSALDKIKDLEAPRTKTEDEEVKYDLPTFTQHLNDLMIMEGEQAKFECKVQPAQDPTIKIGRDKKLPLPILLLFYFNIYAFYPSLKINTKGKKQLILELQINYA